MSLGYSWPVSFYLFGAMGLLWAAAWQVLAFDAPHHDDHGHDGHADFQVGPLALYVAFQAHTHPHTCNAPHPAPFPAALALVWLTVGLCAVCCGWVAVSCSVSALPLPDSSASSSSSPKPLSATVDGVRASLWFILGHPACQAIFFSHFANNCATFVLLSWLPSMMAQQFDLPVGCVGFLLHCPALWRALFIGVAARSETVVGCVRVLSPRGPGRPYPALCQHHSAPLAPPPRPCVQESVRDLLAVHVRFCCGPHRGIRR